MASPVLVADDLIAIGADSALLAQHIARVLRQSGTWTEVVGGIDSVVVQFDAARTDAADALATLAAQLAGVSAAEAADAGVVEIPVIYGGEDGPDLDGLCDLLEMTRAEFIALHSRDEYPVEMLGFTPGFAYLGGLDERLDVPRRPHPRQHVPAGSIGIAGGRTGIYALSGPGGWPLIGRTPEALFDAEAEDPFRLQPGMRVRFRPLRERAR